MESINLIDACLGASITASVLMLVYFIFMQVKKIYVTYVYICVYTINEFGTEEIAYELKTKSHIYSRKGGADAHLKFEIQHTKDFMNAIKNNYSVEGIICDADIIMELSRKMDLNKISGYYVHGKVDTVILADFKPFKYSVLR